MKMALLILAALGLLSGPAAAQGILFDFNDAPLGEPLPITLTVGGVTAAFTATGQGYSVRNVDFVGFTPLGFSGYWLYPNGVDPSDIRVSFSATLKDFSINYSPQELGCDFSAVMRATGFMNDVPVATNTTTAEPGVWPTGLLTLASAQGFNSVVVHYESRPACIDSAMLYMADNMTVTPLVESLFVPIVVSSSFTTELTLTNRGASDATLTLEYVSAFGGGGGQATVLLAAGRQRVVPDGIAWLASLGIPIPASGNRGGTLRVLVSGTPFSEIAVTARTTAALSNGRAGLAYSGAPPASRLSGPSYLCGLRQNGQDRSNVALQNAGSATEGSITLRLTVYPGDAAASPGTTLPDVTLPPGGWTQYNAILAPLGLSSGYVKVERVSGSAQYLAYAVINDQANSDGSFVPAVPEAVLAAQSVLALPVLVETSSFATELVATNWSPSPKTLQMTYVADAVGTPDHAALYTLVLGSGEQQILPGFVERMRAQGTAGIGPAGPTFAGGLFVTEAGGDLGGVAIGARVATVTPPGGGGQFGLFFTAQAVDVQTAPALWVYGLQQNAETRTNLALLNLGQPGDPPDLFDVEIYDGDTGARVSTVAGVALGPRAWKQFGAILSMAAPGVTQGYAQLVRTSGASPFVAYGVLNDGAVPGQRTGDGAFYWAVP